MVPIIQAAAPTTRSTTFHGWLVRFFLLWLLLVVVVEEEARILRSLFLIADLRREAMGAVVVVVV